MSLFSHVIWKPAGNRLRALNDEVFWISLRHTPVWIAGTIVVQLLLGFVTALLLTREFRRPGSARSLILIPRVAPSVITTLMWQGFHFFTIMIRTAAPTWAVKA